MKRKMSRTVLAKTLSLLLVLILLVVACVPLVSTHQAPFPGGYDSTRFVIDTIGDPETMDPAWAYDTASREVIFNVYETLIFFDVNYEDGPYNAGKIDVFVPKLSTQAGPTIQTFATAQPNPVPGGLPYKVKWTFPIRTGVHFHPWTASDGTPHPADDLTPEDVEYSIERGMIQDRDSGPQWMFFEPLLQTHYALPPDEDPDFGSKINGAVESDANNVYFYFPEPYSDLTFKQVLCQSWSSVVDKTWALDRGDFDGNWATSWADIFVTWHNPPVSFLDAPDPVMVGTGPYKFSFWTRYTGYSIERFADYWQGWPAPCESAIGGAGDATTLGGFIERVTWNELASWTVRRGNFLAGTSDETVVPRNYRDQVLGQIVGGEKIRCYYPLQPMLSLDAFFFTFDVATTSNYMGVPLPPGTFNPTGMPPDMFSDVNVRKGFAYAFNYQNYLATAYLNEGTQPSSPVIPELPYINPANPMYSYDLNKARYYLMLAWGGVDSRSGVPNTVVLPEDSTKVTPGALWNGGMKFTVTYNFGNVPRELASTEIVNEVNSINPGKFALEALGLDWGTQILPAMIASQLPVFVLGWSTDFADPHNYVFPLMHSQGRFAAGQRYSNPRVDELVTDGIKEPDDTQAAYEAAGKPLDAPDPRTVFNNPGGLPPDTTWKRRSVYYELERIYYDDVPSVPIVQPLGRHWEQAWMRGWYYNALYPGEYIYHRWKAMTHFGDVSSATYGRQDGAVDASDAGFISAHWSKPALVYGYHPTADINGGIGATTGDQFGPVRGMPDGKVDKSDLDMVSAYWDSPKGPSHPSIGGAVLSGAGEPENITTSVSPLRNTKLVGETFSINITINEVQQLRGYNYVLRYNTTVLTAINYTNLAYLVDPQFTQQWPSEINDAQGYVIVSYQTSSSTGLTTMEPKPLLAITFQVGAAGTSVLNIDEAETRLFDMYGYVWGSPYNLKVNDGLVTTPEVAVSPQLVVGPPPKISEIFTVNITISDVVDLYTWQVGMNFNPNVLEALNISEGEFLKRAGVPTLWTPGTINNTLGKIHYSACSITGATPGVNGTGQLMSITFKVKDSGNSTLHPTDVLLLDSDLASIEPVNIVDGHVEINVEDIAILSLSKSATEAYPTWTVPFNITVVVQNQGTRTETFNVTAYANATIIETRSVTLDSNANTSLIFIWHLNGTAEGEYMIRAEASVLYGEIDIVDNTLTDGIVRIKHPGDANGDNVLNAYDLGILAKAWGTTVGDTLYDPRADFNGDSQIDTIDHEILKSYWP